MEETLQTLSDLVDQGKILYYGVSEEWSAARLERAQRIISERGLHPLTVVQPEYNMMDRYIEHEIVDVCDYYNIGITPFSPLAQGLLTGKYRKGSRYRLDHALHGSPIIRSMICLLMRTWTRLRL